MCYEPDCHDPFAVQDLVAAGDLRVNDQDAAVCIH